MTFIENRYAPQIIGDGTGGLFKLDSATARAGWRCKAPYACTPRALWVYIRTVGTHTPLQVRMRVIGPAGGDDYLPDDADNSSTRVLLASGLAAGWQRILLDDAATPVGQTDPRAAGEVMHFVFEKHPSDAGFDASNYVEFTSVKSRFPLQYTYECNSRGEPIRDDLNAFMYTTNYGSTTTPYCAQKDSNASYHPLFMVECSDAPAWGNPYDVITDSLVAGDVKYSVTMRLPAEPRLSLLAMYGRGKGDAGDSGIPQDDLWLSIYIAGRAGSTRRKLVYGPAVLIAATARLFKARSHFLAHILSDILPLAAQGRVFYTFELSAPGCDGSGANPETDGYLLTNYTTSLVTPLTSIGVRGFLGPDAFLERNRVAVSRFACDSPIILRDYEPASTPIAIIDEMANQTTGFPVAMLASAAVSLIVLVRNIGADVTAGFEIWSDVVDAVTGVSVTNEVLTSEHTHTAVVQNDENGKTYTWSMAATDMHLHAQCGHMLNGQRVLDDYAPLDIRVKTP